MKWAEMYNSKGTLIKKKNVKPIVDILMTIALLLLMSYELIGSTAHEIVGIVMFVLFIVHHTLNIHWTKSLFKGRQTPLRIFQDLLVVLILICMLGSTISGVIISRHIFTFLNIKSAYVATRIHMLLAYWGFVFMSLHLGLHLNMICMMIKNKKQISPIVKTAFKIVFALIFAYGIFVFFKRDIAGYLFLKNQFFLLGDNEHLPFYLLDYISIMFTFAILSHLISKQLRKRK
ncbi:DUF4405 domain-containing protein [Ruminococcus bromii]|uniref:DUF4405 domain-containing protein n=2 Tax=Ruminococcus bromii TaxID=40518 RepID=UPI003A95DB87